MRNFSNRISLSILLLLMGCSGLERSEQERFKKSHAQGEKIYRGHEDTAYVVTPPSSQVRDPYPWEKEAMLPAITKERFHCKGSSLHPPHVDYKDPSRPSHYFDCGGRQKHSLPIREGKEFIYPVLIELLNEVQKQTHSKVVITCGYRCPIHNAYADPSSYNETSKHMIGAEVDFYVEGFENRPEEIINILLGIYSKKEGKNSKFARLDPKSLNVATAPWYNEEVLIKLYHKNEGRDFDNQHPYPYIAIQVRYDRDLKKKVSCDSQQAFRCYHRY